MTKPANFRVGAALGRARPARFLQHFETGKGDYTREREKELGKLTMSELRQRVRRGKKRN